MTTAGRPPAGRLTVGVLCPVLGGFYFGRTLAGMARVLRAAGHRVVAVQTYPADLDRDEFPVPPAHRHVVGRRSFDGLVVVTTALAEGDLRALDESGVPLVLLGVQGEGLRAPSVVPDNSGGVRAAVDHLVAHGHRHIGFVGNTDQQDTLERYEAYRGALAAHGLEARAEWFYATRDNQEASAEAVARRLVERELPTTATLAATDRNAIGFMRGLRAAGLELPEDQAVVGVDRSDSGARARPRLSTVDPMHDAVGERAAELMLARLRGLAVTGTHRLTRSALITRESCGCVEGVRGDLVVAGTTTRRPDDEPMLADVARVAFPCVTDGTPTSPAGAGHGAGHGGGHGGGHGALRRRPSPVDVWLHALQRMFRSAAELAVVPPVDALAELADRTAALRPSPDALEQLVPAVRAEAARWTREAGRRTPSPGRAQVPRRAARLAAVEDTARHVLVAFVHGCSQPALVRVGRLEQDIAEQNEVDLELMRSDGAALRRLDWLPRGHSGAAALALWEDDAESSGGRLLRIVGARGVPGAERLVGTALQLADFPPSELTDPRTLTVVTRVAFGRSDRGFLLVGGIVDARSTSTRVRYDHWAAMLSVALDAEGMLSSLQDQRRELAQAAERERVLALEVEASRERAALVQIASQDGTWDWDVESGEVRYSEAWARIVGCDVRHLGDDAQEWLGRVHPDDARAVHAAVAAQLSGAHQPLDVEHRVRAADGRYVRVRCRAVTVHDAGDRPARMVGAMAVLSDLGLFRSELRERVLADPDTGLVARDLFVDRLERAILRARRVDGYDWQLLALGFPQSPSVPTLHRLQGELGGADCAYAAAPCDVVVLLDGADEASARERVARLRAVLGAAVGIERVVGLPTPAGDAIEALRRAGDALARYRAPRQASPSRDRVPRPAR